MMPAVWLVEHAGRRYEPPVALEAERELVAPAQAPLVVVLAADLAKAVATGNETLVKKIRMELEHNILHDQDSRYRLVEITYDPIERLHGGPMRTQVVREFKTGAP